MTVDALRRIAHARALMLGSRQFPPTAHLAYLDARGPHGGTGLGRLAVADLVLRDVDVPAEQPEVIRVISETLITFGAGKGQLTPAAVSATPARLLAANLVWFGFERAGRLVGLHGGFFWNETLWIRRFQTLLDPGGGAWETNFLLDSGLYGHLWDQGMREAMIMVPTAPAILAERYAAGWSDSHEVHFADNARPFMWLRKRFVFQPGLHAPVSPDPAWQAET